MQTVILEVTCTCYNLQISIRMSVGLFNKGCVPKNTPRYNVEDVDDVANIIDPPTILTTPPFLP